MGPPFKAGKAGKPGPLRGKLAPGQRELLKVARKAAVTLSERAWKPLPVFQAAHPEPFSAGERKLLAEFERQSDGEGGVEVVLGLDRRDFTSPSLLSTLGGADARRRYFSSLHPDRMTKFQTDFTAPQWDAAMTAYRVVDVAAKTKTASSLSRTNARTAHS